MLAGEDASSGRPNSSRTDVATSVPPNPSTIIFVETDSRGEAKVYLRLGKSVDNSD